MVAAVIASERRGSKRRGLTFASARLTTAVHPVSWVAARRLVMEILAAPDRFSDAA